MVNGVKISAKVDVLVPKPLKGSGGHRTIYSHARALADGGCDVTIHIEGGKTKSGRTLRRAKDWFESGSIELSPGWPRVLEVSDMLMATTWQSALFSHRVETPAVKAHFVQDYESLFYPMGDMYLGAISAHDLGFETIVIGEWLRGRMRDSHQIDAYMVPFSANLGRYSPPAVPRSERPGLRRVVAMYQPEKSRRCPELMVDALSRVLKADPAVEVATVGSRWDPKLGSRHVHHGVVSPDELGKIYRNSDVGLSLSTSNPSRAPFEMMATGLPVVELGLENNLHDLPDTACVLANPDGISLSDAMMKIIGDRDLASSLSAGGVAFMSSRDEAEENSAFVFSVKGILAGRKAPGSLAGPIYREEIFRASKPSPLPVSRDVRLRDRIKRRLIRS